MLSDWWQKNIAWLMGPSCSLCEMTITSDQLKSSHHAFWCTDCRESIVQPNRCQSCGLPSPEPISYCGTCLAAPPPWHRLYCLNGYQPPLSDLVVQLKYQRQFWHARPLAIELADIIDRPAPVITCVPMHWRRLWWRGFNHSEHLGYFVSHQLGRAFQPNIFKRTRYTKPQRGLNASRRKTNLKSAFTLNQIPNSKHVAIVDDVVTTGETIQHLCKLLLDVGVETIDIYCVCRTTLNDSND